MKNQNSSNSINSKSSIKDRNQDTEIMPSDSELNIIEKASMKYSEKKLPPIITISMSPKEIPNNEIEALPAMVDIYMGCYQ